MAEPRINRFAIKHQNKDESSQTSTKAGIDFRESPKQSEPNRKPSEKIPRIGVAPHSGKRRVTVEIGNAQESTGPWSIEQIVVKNRYLFSKLLVVVRWYCAGKIFEFNISGNFEIRKFRFGSDADSAARIMTSIKRVPG
jgi:hypothetical protein